jgi:hypothetical protein
MNRRREIKMFPNVGIMRCSLPYEIFDRIRRHFVGRVVTFTAATALTRSSRLPYYLSQPGIWGIYGLAMSIVVLVSAAADGGAGLVVQAHYGPASASGVRDCLPASRRAPPGTHGWPTLNPAKRSRGVVCNQRVAHAL